MRMRSIVFFFVCVCFKCVIKDLFLGNKSGTTAEGYSRQIKG